MQVVLIQCDEFGETLSQEPLAAEWPTLLMLFSTYALWAFGTTLASTFWMPLGIVVTAIAIAQYCSLQHEVLHDHPFTSRRLNEALVFPALHPFVPYRRFRETHLAHHHDPVLTDPYDDPESNYQDPAMWEAMSPFWKAVLGLNNTLLGRLLIGPAIGTWSFIAKDVTAIGKGEPGVLQAWLMHGLGLLLVVAWLLGAGSMPIWAYLVAVYLATSLLKIRTFLEHRAHEAARARTVVIEDSGPLALLFLNNNLHVVHHMHPSVPWYRLPALYRANRAHYLRRNDGYAYRSYAEVFGRHLFRRKDPVPHPLWPYSQAMQDDELAPSGSEETAA